MNPLELWPALPPLPRLFVIILGVVAVVAIRSLVLVAGLLGVVGKAEVQPSSSPGVFRTHVLLLQQRLGGVHHLLLWASYLFGLCFFLSLPGAFKTLDHSSTPTFILVFENLQDRFAFAAYVFLVLLILYSLYWIVSSRVTRALARLAENQ